MASEFHFRRRVEFADTDAAGIAHFTSCLRYMEEAEHAFLRSLGLSVHLREGDALYSFPRLSCRCEYLRPLRFEEEVTIELRVRRVGRSSLTYQFLVTTGGEVVALGETTAACCRLLAGGRMEPAPLPEPFASAIEECRAPPLAFREPVAPCGPGGSAGSSGPG